MPADVLVLVIDYLDSPSMMNSREVSKNWLDAVDGTLILWNFFYVAEGLQSISNQKMFEQFASKSKDAMVSYSVEKEIPITDDYFVEQTVDRFNKAVLQT